MKPKKEDIYSVLTPSLSDRFAIRAKQTETEEKEPSFFAKHKLLLSILFFIFAISSFSTAAHYSYKYTVKPIKLEEITLVKRNPAPLRVIPDDPGGMEVSNQDKLIYDNFSDPAIKEAKKRIIANDKKTKKNPLYKAVAAAVEEEPKKIKQSVPVKKKPKIKKAIKSKKKIKKKVAKKKKQQSIFDFAEES